MTHDSNKGGSLYRRIKSDLGTSNPKPDILFISHFDRDHINGIQYLDPKIVVLPLLSPDHIHLLKIFNTIGIGNVEMVAIINPKQLFPNSKIFLVKPEVEEEPRNFSIAGIEGSTFARPENIASGTIFDVAAEAGSNNYRWEYMVYNPNWNRYVEDFKNKAKGKGLEIDKMLENPNGDIIYQNIEVLKGIYNELGHKNLHSLQVYSGSVNRIYLLRLALFNSLYLSFLQAILL